MNVGGHSTRGLQGVEHGGVGFGKSISRPERCGVQKPHQVRFRISEATFVPILLAAGPSPKSCSNACSNPGGIGRHVAVSGGLKPRTA